MLPPDRAAGSVHFGHTVGDNLVFHPDDPDEIFAPPRHSAKVYRIGRGLDEALDWLFLSGRLTRKMPRRVFLPHTERRIESWSIGLPYTKARRRLLALGIHDDITEDDARQRNLELLVRDSGGTISLNGPERDEVFVVVRKTINGVIVPPDDPEPSDLILDCDPGCRSPRLTSFLALAAELAGE